MADNAAAGAAPVSLADLPRAGQRVAHNGAVYETIKEGKAYILVPPGTATSTDPKKAGKHDDDEEQRQKVFYNPIQQFNRDLSVLAIRAFGEDAIAQKARKHAHLEARERKRRERKRKNQAGQEPSAEGNDNKRQRVESAAETSAADVTEAQAAEQADDAAAPSGQDTAKDDSTMYDDSKLSEDLRAFEQAAPPASNDGQQAQQHEPEPNTNGSTKRPKFRILDALSASGLRALRYAHELPFVTSVTGNDLSDDAVKMMRLNVKHNRLEGKITPTIGNAVAHMYQFVGQEGIGGPGPRYDVIDLDPYGTAVPFLDAAIQAIADGGLLCVTCTDAGVFASTGYLEKTYSLYGGLPMKGLHSHEGGLRLILHSIATTGAKYGISIEPLLSLSIDFYARVWVRVRKSPAEVKFLAGRQMLVYNCDSGCGAWTPQYLARNMPQENKKGGVWTKHSFSQGPTASLHCPHCGFKNHIAGPMWGGPLHNPAFIERILSYLPDLDKDTYGTTERIEGMLRTAHAETLFDTPSPYEQTADNENDMIPKMDPVGLDLHPFYLNVSHCAKILHCQAPSEAAFKGALRHAGYRCTRSHTKPGTVKTDAPWAAIWEVMREWVRQKAPIKEDKIKQGTPGYLIWQKRRTEEEIAAAEAGQEASVQEGEDKDKDAADVEAPAGEGEEQTKTAARKKKKKWTPGDGEAPLRRIKIIFDEKLGKDRDDKKVVRYQMNPRANWGPMNRAK